MSFSPNLNIEDINFGMGVQRAFTMNGIYHHQNEPITDLETVWGIYNHPTYIKYVIPIHISSIDLKRYKEVLMARAIEADKARIAEKQAKEKAKKIGNRIRAWLDRRSPNVRAALISAIFSTPATIMSAIALIKILWH